MLKILDIEKEFKDYEPLLQYLINKYYVTAKKINIDKCDLESYSSFALIKAIKTYDKTKRVQKDTYYSSCIKNQLNDLLKAQKREYEKLQEVNITTDNDTVADNIDIMKEYEDNLAFKQLSINLKDVLTQKQFDILVYLIDGYSPVAIAKILNTTRQNISQTIKVIQRKYIKFCLS